MGDQFLQAFVARDLGQYLTLGIGEQEGLFLSWGPVWGRLERNLSRFSLYQISECLLHVSIHMILSLGLQESE